MNNKYIVYLIGLPASGKSTYIKNNLKDYVIISNDMLVEEYAQKHNLVYGEAWEKVSFSYIRKELKKRFETAVSQKKNICIDNTNMTVKSRRTYDAKGYIKKAIVFNISEDERRKREQKRFEETKKFIPYTAIEQMKNIFKYPTLDEGFISIEEVNF